MRAVGYRVGFILEGMAGPGSGTWSRFETLARGLARAGNSVHVLAHASLQRPLLNLPLASAQLIPQHSRLRRLTDRKKISERFVAEMSVEILHIEAPPFPRIAGALTLGSIHDLRYFHDPLTSVRTTEGIYQRVALGRQAKNLSGVATLGPWAAGEVVTRLGIQASKVHVIPPIVEPRIELIPTERPGSRPFVLILGHLERRKNIATIVRAAASKAWPEDLDLVIAGIDSGERNLLLSLAGDARCRVNILGGVDEQAKWKLLSEAEIVVVPSLLEGFGIVAVEAPIAGTPVLVSDRTALPDLAGDPEAVVPALDPEAWASRIRILHENDNVRSRILAAQQSAARRFGPESVIPEVMEIYAKMVASNSGARRT